MCFTLKVNKYKIWGPSPETVKAPITVYKRIRVASATTARAENGYTNGFYYTIDEVTPTVKLKPKKDKHCYNYDVLASYEIYKGYHSFPKELGFCNAVFEIPVGAKIYRNEDEIVSNKIIYKRSLCAY